MLPPNPSFSSPGCFSPFSLHFFFFPSFLPFFFPSPLSTPPPTPPNPPFYDPALKTPPPPPLPAPKIKKALTPPPAKKALTKKSPARLKQNGLIDDARYAK